MIKLQNQFNLDHEHHATYCNRAPQEYKNKYGLKKALKIIHHAGKKEKSLNFGIDPSHALVFE